MSLGILVHGGNHFIVRGPLPTRDQALRLARHWSIIRIGGDTPEDLRRWRISNKEFREDLEWAVIAPGEGDHSPAVKKLLEEMESRGVRIRDAASQEW